MGPTRQLDRHVNAKLETRLAMSTRHMLKSVSDIWSGILVGNEVYWMLGESLLHREIFSIQG